jgi:hypothetical protein
VRSLLIFVTAITLLLSCSEPSSVRKRGKKGPNIDNIFSLEGAEALRELEAFSNSTDVKAEHLPAAGEKINYTYSLTKSASREFFVEVSDERGKISCPYQYRTVEAEEVINSVAEQSFIFSRVTKPTDAQYVGFGTESVKELCESKKAEFLAESIENREVQFSDVYPKSRARVKNLISFVKEACPNKVSLQVGICEKLILNVRSGLFNSEAHNVKLYELEVAISANKGSLGFKWQLQLERPYFLPAEFLEISGEVAVFEERGSLSPFEKLSIQSWTLPTQP